MAETLKILVIDDDEVDRLAVRRSLQKAGIPLDFSEATDCATAIAALENYAFDCVFLDYRLPDQDGLDLVKQLKSIGIRIPLIVLTGQGDEQIAVEMMKAGASDYLSKSRVSTETLLPVLRNAIRVYRAERETEQAYQRLQESNELLQRQNQELERQRQKIERQNQLLQEVSRLKSEFLATMSHELRTPMNAIMGFSQMLLLQSYGSLNEQQGDMVERILNNSQNLLMLLNEVLDFSKIEAGHMELIPDAFDLGELMTITTEELRSLALQKQLSLEIGIDLENSQVINDRGCIRRILINLLSNAIKFTEAGGVCVKVSEVTSERIAIAVKDTGCGIAPENLEHIFEAFRQGDQSLTRKHSGTGLGLAIADSLIKMMQGTIRVESQLGKGSVFRVEIPRQVKLSKKAI